MKELKSYFEGLLDRTSVKVKNIDLIPNIIEEFLKENYNIKGSYTIKGTKDGFVVDVKGDVEVKNKDITSLTNEVFEFGSVGGDFYCSYCTKLTSLEGAPKEVDRDFDCAECKSLTSLEGAPKEVDGWFDCSYCDSLTSLEGAPEKIKENFYCEYCDSLASLKGAPKEVGMGFYCDNCKSLKTLEGAPKKVGRNFDCRHCGVKFEEEDVKKYTNVVKEIYT